MRAKRGQRVFLKILAKPSHPQDPAAKLRKLTRLTTLSGLPWLPFDMGLRPAYYRCRCPAVDAGGDTRNLHLNVLEHLWSIVARLAFAFDPWGFVAMS